MNIHKIVNIFCGITGIAVLIFAIAVRSGMVDNVDPSKSTLLFILGAIVVLWAFISSRRHR